MQNSAQFDGLFSIIVKCLFVYTDRKIKQTHLYSIVFKKNAKLYDDVCDNNVTPKTRHF